MSSLLDALFDDVPEDKDEFFEDCKAQEIINKPTNFVQVRDKKRLADLNGTLANSPYANPAKTIEYMIGGPRNQLVRKETVRHENGDISVIEHYADGHTEEKREGIRL